MAVQKPNSFLDLNSTSLLWVVDNVLTPHQCFELIQLVEKEGFYRTRHGTPGKTERFNARVIQTDMILAQLVYAKIKDVIPQELVGLRPLGTNDCLRFYRYEENDFFKPHQDTDHFISSGNRSLLSVVVYLNSDYEGGELHIPARNEMIKPECGQAVVFGHRLVHESKPIRSGVKYAFRTDVMYCDFEVPEVNHKTIF